MQKNSEKLYDLDSFIRDFTAVVTGCSEVGGQFCVTLSRTAFYPEGGGQPADTGTLGGARVLDVRENRKDGGIVHTTDAPLPLGREVRGSVDWARRFTHMQQHSGEHIVSGVVRQLFGLQNIGFHMGPGSVTVDFDGALSESNLEEVERRANEAVWADLPVDTRYPSGEELAALPYRSKKELAGDVRIVTVPGYDICACCGTHVRSTGQIGVIRLFSAQKYKGGTRVSMLCGGRARAELAARDACLARAGAALSVGPLEVPDAVGRLLQEAAASKQAIVRLQDELFRWKAQAAVPREGHLCLLDEGLTPDALRRFCLLLIPRCPGAAAVFSGSDADGYRYAAGSAVLDMRVFGKEMNAALAGRGGGGKELIQGSVSCTGGQILRFFGNEGAKD